MKSSVNISLKEIIQRKRDYCLNDKDQDSSELNAGYIRGFNQILEDMDLDEGEFLEKYINILKEVKNTFEHDKEAESNQSIDELCGYNNALIDVLSLLDFKYLFIDF